MPEVSHVSPRRNVKIKNERYDQYHETKTGKKFIQYHTNWSNYGRNFQVKDLPISYIPEISYAFFNVDAKGNVFSGDTWADFEKRYISPDTGVEPVDDWVINDGIYGNIGQFLKLKQQGKKFNLTLSIGGWTWSKYFSSAVLPENRINFAESINNIFDKYPVFCGVSLDWEYITSDGVNRGNNGNEVRPEDADNFIDFVITLRGLLNDTGKSHYKISVCCSAGHGMAKQMKAKELEPYIDEFHLMTYDLQVFS